MKSGTKKELVGVHIVSDGTCEGTKVTTDGGDEIDHIYAIDWQARVEGLDEVTIRCRLSRIDMKTQARVVCVCPMCEKEMAAQAEAV